MTIFTVQASGSTAVARNYPNTNYSDLTQYKLFAEPFTNKSGAYAEMDNILLKFGEPESEYKYKRITRARLVIYAMPTAGISESWGSAYYIAAHEYGLQTPLDTNTVTYATKPKPNQRGGSGESTEWSELNQIVQVGITLELPSYDAEKKRNLESGLRNGFLFAFLSGGKGRASEAIFYGAKSSHKPFLECEYSDDNVGILASDFTPASGAFVNRTQKSTFTWECKDDTDTTQVCFAEVKQVSAVFEWREKNTSTSKTINVFGAGPVCEVPANTFPSGSIEWRVRLTANSGVQTTSAWQSITTVDATPTAKPVSPSGVVIDATISNRFSWQHIISTGSAQSKADLQWSADGEAWTTFATVTGANQYYDVPANTFASGTKYWRVRTYNTDGTASEWSAKAEFIAINAPSVPSISVKSTGPRPQITWNTTEQEAYQVTLSNGYASGTVYGTAKAWQSPVYLADGTYTVRVRIQNQYGMWSEWGSAALPVSHTEGPEIALEVSASHEAALDWQTAGGYDFYLIERDGIAIAKTEQKQYVDHTSIGSVVYRVRGCYTGSDNYGLSAAKRVEVAPETNMICDLESGAWLEMRLSESQARTNRASFSAGVAAVHLAGLAYPIEERSGQRDRTIAVVCAWPHAQRAEALVLESLVSRKVCLKDQYGNMAIGTLSSLESSCDSFMRRYSFSIAHTNQEEGVSLDT